MCVELMSRTINTNMFPYGLTEAEYLRGSFVLCDTEERDRQVGGIKDKVLAAHRAGVKCVILPKRNEQDLEDLPANVRSSLDFILVSTLDQVLNGAFDGGFPGTERPPLSMLSKL